jgi:two-component system cell cycle sensor histidine kinase/response regulator CckA
VMVRGIWRDETERKRVDEQLRRAERMQAAGQLAGGVAHEVNNMMTGVIGFGSFLLRGLDPDDPRRADVEEIIKAGNRAADVTRQLLAFTRQQFRRPEILELNQVIAGVERMLRRSLSEGHDLALRLGRQAGRVRMDRGQLEQILVNLILNARDAIEGTGRIAIETGRMVIDGDYARRHELVTVPSGAYALLAVSDNGSGMVPEVQARMFEPFFTTKPVGQGTGLGLSTVYGIVKQSGGVVGVESEPGKGATFTAYLPCAPAAMLHATPREGPRAKEPGGTETILLAEDETALRRLVRQVLERQGYHVLESSDGAAALATADAYQGRIDALVTDVVMPVMGGRELSERLRDRRPDVKVLFMSGYSNEDIAGIAMTNPLVTFLQKPFVPKALVGAVRDLLDAPMPRHKV